MNPTREEALKELRRELRMRDSVYPRWVNQGKMRVNTAKRQYARLKKAIELITGEPEPTVHQQSLFD